MKHKSLVERLQTAKISRRDFLKGSMAATAAIALAGCKQADQEQNSLTETTKAPAETEVGEVAEATMRASDAAILGGKGKWVSAACWHNCGGRCVNYAYVQDGIVIRQKTDDNHEDTWEMPQQRSCLRGHAQRMQVFSADRLKYPMKRKTWSLENPNPQNRGKDEWVRMSWDEAIEVAADALKKTYDTYGPRAVLSCGGGGECNGGNKMSNLLNTLGGAVTTWSTSSLGTYAYPWDKYIGITSMNTGAAAGRNSMLKADTIVLHGLNPAWSTSGIRTYIFTKCKEAGVQLIVISPDYNASAQQLEATWIPITGGTDTAFMLGVAYAMLEMDDPEKNPIIDWEFLNKYTVGFDAEHMPEDAKTNENFKGYVLGEYDGIPKTPEWASKICGTPVEQIRWYAEQIGMKHKVQLLQGFAPARCAGAENFPQMFMTLGAMGGHFGKEGHACASGYKNQANGGISMVKNGGDGFPSVAKPIDDHICDCDIWKAVDSGTYRFTGKGGYTSELKPAEERKIEIHAIYLEDRSALNGYTGLARGLKAITKKDSTVDVIITNSYNFRMEAQYADIVFPVTTMWEREGRVMHKTADRECMICSSKVVEPQFEAKSDREVGMLLAEKLGLSAKELYPLTEKQEQFNMLAGSTVYDKGEYVPLVTITEEDIKSWGVEGQAQEGKISLQEICEKGIYQIPHTEDDGTETVAYEAFIKDPEANPLPSKSGKFEIYCQSKADNLNATGMADIEFKPYANYVFADQSYENTFKDFEKQEKGEYPYLAWNPHYLRRSHSVMDSNIWLREVCTNPVFINTEDAKEKGITTGDSVKIYNEFGAIVRNALVTATVKPGMVGVPHGTWSVMDEEKGIDFGGTDNILCGGSTSNCGVAGYNNYTCNFEKYTEQMESDSDRGIRLPGLE